MGRRISAILKSKIVKNTGWIIASRIYHMLLSLIVGLLTARYLGPSNYGLINYAASYTTFFAALSTLGIGSVIIKDFVDNPDEQGFAIGSAIILRIVSSALSVIMMVGITFMIDVNETTTHLVVLFCGIGMIFQSIEIINYWFQEKLQSKYSAIAVIVSYTVVSAYKVWLLATGKSVEWFAISNSIDYFVLAFVLLVVYKKKNGPRFSFSVKKAKELLKLSSHYMLSGMMVAIYTSTDKIMLKHLLDEAQVGFYSTALTLSNSWTFILAAINESLFPVILQSFGNAEVFERKNKQLYSIIFYFSFSVALLVTILANPIVTLLYGAAYLPAAASLRIVTWNTAFSYLGSARDAWIISYKRQRYLIYLYAGSAVTNVILNALLIPGLGASGAALASLVTQISTIVIFPALIPDLRPNVRLMLDAIRLKDVF